MSDEWDDDRIERREDYRRAMEDDRRANPRDDDESVADFFVTLGVIIVAVLALLYLATSYIDAHFGTNLTQWLTDLTGLENLFEKK